MPPPASLVGDPPAQTPDLAFRFVENGVVGADLQVLTAAGDWMSVHSTDDPRAEARRLVDQALKGEAVPPIVALLGVGLGYIIDEIEARRADVRIVAVELVPGLVAACRPHRDWTTRNRQGRLVFAADPAQPLQSPAWPVAAIAEKPLAIVNPVLARHCPQQYEDARRVLKQFFYEQRANAEARRRLAGIYLQHTLENLPALTESPDVSALDGIAKGEPVLLIGAGPSLDRLLPELAANRQSAWFVALDTALKPLLHAGIVPDLVISVDPTTLNGRHLINLPVRSRPYLVAEPSIDPRAMSAFSGRVFTGRIGRADPWPWLESLGLDATRLKVWGSVLTASVDLLVRMQAGTCIFAAMDLAYTNDQPYCRNTSFEHDWHQQQLRDGLPSIAAVWEKRISEIAIADTDIDGQTVRTAPQMVAFRNWVRTHATSALALVNVTGAGILHGPGIAQGTLDDALRQVTLTSEPQIRLRRAMSTSKPLTMTPLKDAIGALLDDGEHAVWKAWAEAIPNFDARAIGLPLQAANQRLSRQPRKADHMMHTNETDWIDVPYDPANFHAKAPLVWKVAPSSVVTYAYRVQGKTMTLSFKIARSALTGLPSQELYLKIPGNYLPHRSMANAVWLRGWSGGTSGYATVHPGFNYIVVLRESEEAFPVEPGAFFVFGQLTFEVQ